ncbi:uncharacterized protein LTR77_007075 [Saxophila tyrrhenica]|uniref:BAR domain-containing protein n=1 Tax=Saxophila tyrrhenica TaxID=1690608 RepID=A0AAV9P5L7_9PEZI|nr:hypothetical protein LTR77_007075 [Saxophila tyrrhenica]
MNVNKKFDRLKQWGKERMGAEATTTTTEEFKALQTEMDLRHAGMDRLQLSTSAYIKSLSSRTQGEGKEKQLPVGYFGNTLMVHGDDFEADSEFGQCLLSLGRANERIARMQETYCANATSSWLESVERSQVQMKEYQAARKKLESRRLAYDTASVKMQKSKKEDYRMEEELRSQKAKYEESQEEVVRRMMDIKEAEQDSVADLTSFLEAECAYYDRCREVLVQLRKDWPATSTSISRSSTASPVNGLPRRPTARSRASSINTDSRFSRITEEEPAAPPNLETLRGGGGSFASRSTSAQNSPRRELPNFDFSGRPAPLARSTSNFQPPVTTGRDQSPAPMPRLSRVPTEPTQILAGRNNLRVTKRVDSSQRDPVFGDDASDASDSASELSRISSWTAGGQQENAISKKGPPPPPPPSRNTKPAPPPLPMKRSALSTGEVPRG